ncbi:MAG: hypothetical protein FWE37_09355 [Spirochaetaceae bacterium]|nr:hypothetical protein [Spirochaetaceae bacterium]
MQIILKRQLVLNSSVVYLKLSQKIKREDIQAYLNKTISFDNSIVEQGVKKYLQEIKLTDEHGNLTKAGLEAKETGLVKEQEEGKYQIWYTQNDELFDNRVFYFKRVKGYDPDNEKDTKYGQRLNEVNLKNLTKTTFISLPIKNATNADDEFTIEEVSNLAEDRKPITLNLTWLWQGLESSYFTFGGKLSEREIIDESQKISSGITISQFMKRVLPYWNNETSRSKLRLKDITDSNTFSNFEYNTTALDIEGFNSYQYQNLPVEPYNFEEAKVWHKQIVNTELTKEYLHPNDFTALIRETNEKEGFKAYLNELSGNLPNIKQYITELDMSKKSARPAAFWHLVAPYDLNLTIPQDLQLSSFSYAKGDRVSLKDIALKLFNNMEALQQVIYYDRYVINYKQQLKVAALLKSFNCVKTYIVTNTSNSEFNNYLSKQPFNIVPSHSLWPDKKTPHSRFFIFKHDSSIDVWKSDTSSDFIYFDNTNNISPDEKGTISDSVTFTKVDLRVLDEKLKNLLTEGN